MAAPTISWEEYTEGMDPADLEMVTRFRALADGLDAVELRCTRTEMRLVRTRTFASAYVKSHYLEAAIDLTRKAQHPRLKASFATTKTVTTHRLTISEPAQIDDSVGALVREAWETVGPGFR